MAGSLTPHSQRLQVPHSKPLILYDISSPLQPCGYAPNPSKARLALSFKDVDFKTTWVDIPDIPNVRKGLGCPPVRELDDGSDYYTLPMVQDLASGNVIGDSFDIANYLEDTLPDSGGSLFPANSAGTGLGYESPNKGTPFIAPLTSLEGRKNEAYARFNQQVDTTFTANMAPWAQYLPFNPNSAEEVRAMFAKRSRLNSWDDLCIQGETSEQLKVACKEALTSLALLFMVHDTGPYLEGKQANYADLIVGGWLIFFSVIMPKEDWEEFRTWHGGVFARLHDTLRENYFKCI